MWHYVVRNTKWGAMRDVMHNVADMVLFEIWYCKVE